MRLWHVSLIRVLPNKQLQGQWKEIGSIRGAIEKHGTPNHLLVNKVLDYPLEHLIHYTVLVMREMKRRGMKPQGSSYLKIYNLDEKYFNNKLDCKLYEGWHNYRYLRQCLYNLEEKYMCGGISKEEWQKIYDVYNEIFDLEG